MLGRVDHLVAAPDKFRGTASASEVAGAVSHAARAAGWSADEAPMADGGEGTLEAVGGEVRHTVVAGPLGEPVTAEWRMLVGECRGRSPAAGERAPTAVVEMARAAGRALLPTPVEDDPVLATTSGVGQLILAAVDAGAGRVVVGVGGSATTDGGFGAVEAIGSRERLLGAELVVACDVRTPFRSAAAVFGPQKGASPAQVVELGERLDALADRYRRELGVDVEAMSGAGAGGGLAGGLAALGGRLVSGFDLVAGIVGLAERLAGADLVVTGEGYLDANSLEGKVVGGVISMVAGRLPVLCVVGDADPAADPGVEVISLSGVAGPERARRDVLPLVTDVVARYLARRRI